MISMEPAQFGRYLQAARDEVEEARKTVRFFASVIKSGEPFTPACAEAYERAMGRSPAPAGSETDPNG